MRHTLQLKHRSRPSFDYRCGTSSAVHTFPSPSLPHNHTHTQFTTRTQKHKLLDESPSWHLTLLEINAIINRRFRYEMSRH